MMKRKNIWWIVIGFMAIVLLAIGFMFYSKLGEKGPSPSALTQEVSQLPCALIPLPVECQFEEGVFTLREDTVIYIQGNSEDEVGAIEDIAQYLADKCSAAMGFALTTVSENAPVQGGIFLTTVGADPSLGDEGYQLDVTPTQVTLTAFTPEGLFRGIQTLRQMLPADIEKASLVNGVAWNMPCAKIKDYPAYPWRGMMLDVARHFMPIEDVKRTIDLMAGYKMNRFHMHLTDDQGWRIEIKSWPDLTAIGSTSEVGGGEGGFYTQEEYQEIVAYAQARYITVVPEIDMPSHCNAALASYGELNPDGQPKEPYTGMEVGFSTFMCQSEVTYDFIDDVIRELSAITPGQYVHIGGDEAASTSDEDYDYFMSRVNEIVESYGKTAIGWNPFDTVSGTPSDALLQLWASDSSAAQEKGMKMIVSPPDKAYIDMKYSKKTPIGLEWAGLTTTDEAYQWDPTDFAPQEFILGVECPLWSETIETMEDIEYLAFPRLLGHAEIGWTPEALRSWSTYKVRLKDHGQRMKNQEINFYEDPAVKW